MKHALQSRNDYRSPAKISTSKTHTARCYQGTLDLLQLAATSVVNRKNSDLVKAKRWTGPDAFDYILNLGQTGSETEGQGQTPNSDESDAICGVSVICVDLGNAD